MKQSEKTKITYNKILKAAMDEFGVNGYAGASLNNISNTGIPKGLLYHNFENKDAIYIACVKQSYDELVEYLREAEIGDDLQKYMAVRLDFFKTHLNEAHIFFETVLQPPEALQEKIQALRTEFDGLNSKLYQKMISSITLHESVSQEDALSYFSMLQTMFNGYFSSPAFRNLSFADKIIAHEINLSKLLDFMLYGIAERRKTK